MTERNAFVVDLNLCTGCHACEMACAIANRLPIDRSWREVRTYNELHVSGIETFHLSLACNHCSDAPCMSHCPAGAYVRDPRTGAVLIDADLCLGCRYCAWVCPFDAPRFAPELGVMTKCDFCNDRQLRSEPPACVSACPTGALGVERISETPAVIDGIPGLATDPIGAALRVVPLRADRHAPRQTEPPARPPLAHLREGLESMISLRHEWTLAIFSLFASVLVGIFGGFHAGALEPDARIFAAAGVGALLLSASHLGRRLRAWRAARQPGSSGLSREIILFGVFLAAATATLHWRAPATAFALPVLGLGFLMLLAIDRVYAPARMAGPAPLHSAQALATGLLLTAVFQGSTPLLMSLVLLKGVLYLARKIATRSRPLISLIRSGFLLGGAVHIDILGINSVGVALLFAGELIDRLEYYLELEIPTPRSRMLDDLEARASEMPSLPRRDHE